MTTRPTHDGVTGDDLTRAGNQQATMQPSDHEFDRAARRHHAAALAALPPQTRARLRAARQTAASTAPVAHRLGWTLAGSCAAVFALAISVQLHRDPAGAPPIQSASSAPATDRGDALAVEREEFESLVATLDESPDLYLWLAVNDDALPPPLERR